MKKLLLVFVTLGMTLPSLAQKIWYEPEGALMNEEITIYVDLNKLDQGLDHTVLLIDAAQNGEDMYIWTWSPKEHPAGHPLVNGTGSQAWKNSNPALKMEKRDPGDPNSLVYGYTMTPTDFYEVDAIEVYENDISLLVKPQDGGGYGDPDIKSEDLSLGLEVPKGDAATVLGLPSQPFRDDVFTVIYDNTLEENENMQNLGDDEVYLYIAGFKGDSITNPADYEISNFFEAAKNDDLQMTPLGGGKFQYTFIPDEKLGIAPADQLSLLRLIVMKKGTLLRTEEDLMITVGCQ